jgi:SAM-dependent methyltransferase
MMQQFYKHPDLYFALRSPTSHQQGAARDMIRRHLSGKLTSVMDPACGPATWLLPFAQQGLRVAGNDLYPEMVQWAKRVLAGFPAEIREGDMCALDFETGPFDVAFELSGTLGHLLDDATMLAFIRSLARQVRPGGLGLMTLFFDNGLPPLLEPVLSARNGPLEIPGGGVGTITYEILSRDTTRRTDLMRRTIESEGVPSCPPRFQDEYPLRSYSGSDIRQLLAQTPEVELQAVYDLDETGIHEVSLDDPVEEVTLVLKKLG